MLIDAVDRISVSIFGASPYLFMKVSGVCDFGKYFMFSVGSASRVSFLRAKVARKFHKTELERSVFP